MSSYILLNQLAQLETIKYTVLLVAAIAALGLTAAAPIAVVPDALIVKPDMCCACPGATGRCSDVCCLN
ncbi:hypothetical protein BG000_004607 [Podila horticola]|nr:hypothetical protein BG000_004607 [Podila horticola]